MIKKKVTTTFVSNGNVNSNSSHVTKRSNNDTNDNSSLSYLNVNNSPSNANSNYSSQLLTIDYDNFIIVEYIFVTICFTSPLGGK